MLSDWLCKILIFTYNSPILSELNQNVKLRCKLFEALEYLSRCSAKTLNGWTLEAMFCMLLHLIYPQGYRLQNLSLLVHFFNNQDDQHLKNIDKDDFMFAADFKPMHECPTRYIDPHLVIYFLYKYGTYSISQLSIESALFAVLKILENGRHLKYLDEFSYCFTNCLGENRLEAFIKCHFPLLRILLKQSETCTSSRNLHNLLFILQDENYPRNIQEYFTEPDSFKRIRHQQLDTDYKDYSMCLLTPIICKPERLLNRKSNSDTLATITKVAGGVAKGLNTVCETIETVQSLAEGVSDDSGIGNALAELFDALGSI
ncbi:unnamed protein product [Dimorphilus gyrociliatus]|uniref:Uncharacterized protein n=1 Tax=Dimorphilus gyrociliatus TaxID=2664684 RepID=A0A7I8WEQ2_9ANNE|nr:unnamed protein product [Dimorphilus gyrociliatus]